MQKSGRIPLLRASDVVITINSTIGLEEMIQERGYWSQSFFWNKQGRVWEKRGGVLRGWRAINEESAWTGVRKTEAWKTG